MPNDIAGLNAAANAYFEALHTGNVDGLQKIFFPEAHLYASIAGELKLLPIADYIEMVAGREPPSAQGHPLSGDLVSIDFSGPCSAVVKVTVDVPPTKFVDLLNFLKVGDQWRIISKIYHIDS